MPGAPEIPFSAHNDPNQTMLMLDQMKHPPSSRRVIIRPDTNRPSLLLPCIASARSVRFCGREVRRGGHSCWLPIKRPAAGKRSNLRIHRCGQGVYTNAADNIESDGSTGNSLREIPCHGAWCRADDNSCTATFWAALKRVRSTCRVGLQNKIRS